MAVRRGPERALQDAVIELALLDGWHCVHFRPARTATGWRTAGQGHVIGFPDVVAVRGARLVVAELKSERGKVTGEQAAWLEAWRAVGAEVHVWRPSDMEQVAAVLA